MTGRNVAIGGRIDLNLLPRPTLTLARTTLASPPERDDGRSLEVDRLDLAAQAAAAAARPARGGGGPAGPAGAAGRAGAGWPLEAHAAGRRRRMAAARARGAEPAQRGRRPGDVAGACLWPREPARSGEPGAVCRGAGRRGRACPARWRLNGQPLRVDARFGRPTQERSSTLRLELSTEGLGDAGASTATLRRGGLVGADAPGLRGELTITGADARSTVGAVRDRARPGEPADAALAGGAVPGYWPGRARERSARAVRGRARARRHRAGRSAGCSWPRMPEIDLAAPCAPAAMPADLSADARAGGSRPSLPGLAVRGKVDWRWARSTTPACRCSACARPCSCSGDGRRPSAMPGSPCPARPKSGSRASSRALARMRTARQLTAVTENLRGALAALGPAQVAGLNALTLASELSLRRDAWRFGQIELRVDATRVTGSVAVNPAPRPQMPPTSRWIASTSMPIGRTRRRPICSATSPARYARSTRRSRPQLARLTWHGVHLQDLRLATRSVNGRLRVSQLTVGNLAEAEAQVVGRARSGRRRVRSHRRAAQRAGGAPAPPPGLRAVAAARAAQAGDGRRPGDRLARCRPRPGESPRRSGHARSCR